MSIDEKLREIKKAYEYCNRNVCSDCKRSDSCDIYFSGKLIVTKVDSLVNDCEKFNFSSNNK